MQYDEDLSKKQTFDEEGYSLAKKLKDHTIKGFPFMMVRMQ